MPTPSPLPTIDISSLELPGLPDQAVFIRKEWVTDMGGRQRPACLFLCPPSGKGKPKENYFALSADHKKWEPVYGTHKDK